MINLTKKINTYNYNNINNLYNLIVYNVNYPKVRLGRNNDGGYVICDIPKIKYDLLLSGGIGKDISFEKDLLKYYFYLEKCIAFDGTIKKLPNYHKYIEFIRKNIGKEDNEYESNLNNIIDLYDNIFLKMDIEGGEFPWINQISDKHLQKLKQIVIEIHYPNEENSWIFEKLTKFHTLVHIHGNNYAGECMLYNHKIPEVLECTYILDELIEERYLNEKELPDLNLDMKNCLYKKELPLKYFPFVVKDCKMINEFIY